MPPRVLRKAACPPKALLSMFKQPPSESQVRNVFGDFLDYPERYVGALHPLEPSRHAFRLPVGRKQAVAIKIATQWHDPFEQLRAAKIINAEMEKKKPRHFLFMPFRVYFANRDFLVSEIVGGVSMRQLWNQLVDISNTAQAHHFLKTHKGVNTEMLQRAWKEASEMLLEIGDREHIRPDTSDINLMVRGVINGLPVITPIDQGK